MEAVLDELHCPICLEFYRCPIILPCSHILCRAPCAERIFDHGFVRCPVCRDNSFVTGGVENLPRVISLENIIDRYQNPPARQAAPPTVEVGNGDDDSTEKDDVCSPDDIPCQLCPVLPRKAKKSCLDCNASYCQQCLNLSHPDKEPFCLHQLVDPRRYPRPKEPKCPEHDAPVNIFCQDCEVLGCLLCADNEGHHTGHRVLSLEQAAQGYRELLEARVIQKLENTHSALTESARQHQRHLLQFQELIQERKRQIATQCDSLVTAVDLKREFFLSDLDYEDKSKSESVHQRIGDLQEQAENLQSLLYQAREVLKETETCGFIQLAKSLSDRVKQSLAKVDDLPPSSPTAINLNHKVVDLRKEKAVLRDMAYLAVPSMPVIDVPRCWRSLHSVVIVLCPVDSDDDVLDGYEVLYCSTDQKNMGHQNKMVFKTPGEVRRIGSSGNNGSSNSVCLIHDNLQPNTEYYFCVRAYNLAGESEMSEVIKCTTLSVREATLPVPEIREQSCRTYTYSIQIHSPSPVDAAACGSNIAHYLLYRESSVNKIWKSIPLVGRSDHRVFGLESDTIYDFVIMACNENGECQVSNMVCMKTERSAY